MPLKPELEAMIKQLKGGEAYQNAMRQAFEANPEFAANWLRQADYDRMMNTAKADIAAKQKEHEDNLSWYKDANSKYKEAIQLRSTLEQQLKDAETAKVELESRVSELQTRVDSGQYTDAQDSQMLKEIQTLKNTIAEFKEKVPDKENLEQLLLERGQGVINFMSQNLLQTLAVSTRYKSDFGKDPGVKDLEDLYKYANENQLTSLEKAYEQKYAPDLLEKQKSEWKAEWQKEFVTTHSLPNSGGPSPLGPVQQRLANPSADGLPPDASMESVAAAAGAALRSEGKVLPG